MELEKIRIDKISDKTLVIEDYDLERFIETEKNKFFINQKKNQSELELMSYSEIYNLYWKNKHNLYVELQNSINQYYYTIYHFREYLLFGLRWGQLEKVINSINNCGYRLFDNEEIYSIIEYGRYLQKIIMINYNKWIGGYNILRTPNVLLSDDDKNYYDKIKSVFDRYISTFCRHDHLPYQKRYLNRFWYWNFGSDIEFMSYLFRVNKIVGITRIKRTCKSFLYYYNETRKLCGKNEINNNKLHYNFVVYDNRSFDVTVYSKDYIKQDYELVLSDSMLFDRRMKQRKMKNKEYRYEFQKPITDDIRDKEIEVLSIMEHLYKTTEYLVMDISVKGHHHFEEEISYCCGKMIYDYEKVDEVRFELKPEYSNFLINSESVYKMKLYQLKNIPLSNKKVYESDKKNILFECNVNY